MPGQTPFHGGNTGSIPVGRANKIKDLGNFLKIRVPVVSKFWGRALERRDFDLGDAPHQCRLNGRQRFEGGQNWRQCTRASRSNCATLGRVYFQLCSTLTLPFRDYLPLRQIAAKISFDNCRNRSNRPEKPMIMGVRSCSRGCLRRCRWKSSSTGDVPICIRHAVSTIYSRFVLATASWRPRTHIVEEAKPNPAPTLTISGTPFNADVITCGVDHGSLVDDPPRLRLW